MKVLVVGTKGVIETSFVKNYKKTFDIITYPKDANLTNYEEVSKVFKDNKIDKVVFVITNGQINKQEVDTDTIIMFKHIQYASVLNSVKNLIIVSDASDMDITKPLVQARETSFDYRIPTDGYGLNRYLITKLSQKDKISTVLRLYGVYGNPYKPANNIVAKMIAEAKKKNTITLDGNKAVSMTFLEDALKGIAEVVKSEIVGGVYNVVPSAVTSIKDVAKAIKKVAKASEHDVKIIDSKVEDNEYSGDGIAIATLMPKLKFTSLNKGIQKTYDNV